MVARNRSPRVYLPLTEVGGNISRNLEMNLMKFIWLTNCFSALFFVDWFLRWWIDVGSWDLFSRLVMIFSSLFLRIGASCGTSMQLVCFLINRGKSSSSLIRTMKGCFSNYGSPNLLDSSLIRHLRMKSLRSSEKFLLIVYICRLIFSISSLSVEDSQGARPCSIS